MPPAEQRRRARLVLMRRRATVLLAAVALLFLATAPWGDEPASLLGYVHATAAASMIGGLADWFAVVALFRHPLGVPIPHTAIVVERKDQFAETLGEFLQASFLTPEAITERMQAAAVVSRIAAWLSEPPHAERVAAEVVDGLVTISGLLRDHHVHPVLEGLVRRRAETVPVAPLAGRALHVLLHEGRHEPVLDAALRGLHRYVEAHHAELRAQLVGRSRGWLLDAIDQRLFDRVLDALRTTLADMERDHGHHLRLELRTRLAALADDLVASPELHARGEQLKRDLLDRPELERWVAGTWEELKAGLRAQAADPGSDLRRQVAAAVVAAGRRLHEDPDLARRLEAALEDLVRYATQRSGDAIGGLVSATVSRWDAEETASRLEVLLGPDLQWVRINGTVVGAAAGLVLHAVSQAIG